MGQAAGAERGRRCRKRGRRRIPAITPPLRPILSLRPRHLQHHSQQRNAQHQESRQTLHRILLCVQAPADTEHDTPPADKQTASIGTTPRPRGLRQGSCYILLAVAARIVNQWTNRGAAAERRHRVARSARAWNTNHGKSQSRVAATSIVHAGRQPCRPAGASSNSIAPYPGPLGPGYTPRPLRDQAVLAPNRRREFAFCNNPSAICNHRPFPAPQGLNNLAQGKIPRVPRVESPPWVRHPRSPRPSKTRRRR